MENQLITEARVISLTSAECGYTEIELVSATAIESAQRRFMLPVLGKALIEALIEGDYPILKEEYIEPAMAYYTRLEMTPATAPNRKDILRHARLLTRRMSDHIEDNQELYSEYESANNVLRKIRIHGATIEHR